MTPVEVDPDSAAARIALRRYLKDIADLAGLSISVDAALSDVRDYRPPTGAFWVYGNPTPRACAGLRTLSPGVGEIKRMWVAEDERGTGRANTLLATVEQRAQDMGLQRVRLDTNGGLQAAIRFYEKAGYLRIERYNTNPDATHFFEKALSSR